MVAKSFQSMEQICEPYSAGGKMYVQVKNPKTGAERQVRWYSDAEYAKMYPDEAKAIKQNDKYFKTQKEILGFDKGYITIFKGNTYEDKDYFKANSARYNRIWGWYFISTEELPDDIPEDVIPIQLNWDLVGREDGNLMNETEVQKAVESLIYEPTESEFVGEVGERLELWLTVTKAIDLENNFGRSTLHQMIDDCGNTFVWITASKSWEEGSEHHIKGTVKEHKTYRNDKQTVLTRCTEVK